MPILLTILYLIVFIIIVKLFSRREGYYSALTVFGIGCYIYYIGIPFEFYVLNIDEFKLSSHSITLSFSTTQLSQIIMMGITAFLAFSLGYYLSFFKLLKVRSIFQNRFPKIPFSLQLTFIGSFIFLIIFFYKNIFVMNKYEAAYSIRYSGPIFSLLITFVVLYGAVIAATIISRGRNLNKTLGFVLLVLITIWGIYSTDKNVLFVALLAFVATFANFIKKRGFILIIAMFICCTILIYLIKVFSIYRGGINIYHAFRVAIEQFGLRYIDPLGPFVSLQHVLNNWSDFLYGGTYLGIFTLIIPRFLWSNRPLDLSEQFARDTIIDWQPGMGLGFSPLAEAYLNFSWMGPVIQYLFLGLFWGLFWKFIRKILWHYPQDIWQHFYYILGFYMLILMHRSSVTSSIKSMILYAAPLLLFAIVIDLGIYHPIIFMKKSQNLRL